MKTMHGTTLGFLLAAALTARAQERNIALSRPYTVAPDPRYAYTKDDEDLAQLTDSRRSDTDCLWTDRSRTVGWAHPGGPVTITVDLGRSQPIGGASFSTAGGRAGVSFPFAVYVLVSDDGEAFYLLGDLVAVGARGGMPSPIGYKKHTYRSTDLRGNGRFVRFVVVPSGTYVMCDELEVFAGTEEQEALPRGEPVGDLRRFVESRRLTTIVQGRIAADLKTIETLAGDAARFDELWKELTAMPPVASIDWRRGLPYNELHRRVWAAHAGLVRDRFPSALVVWNSDRWAPLDPFDLPDEARSVEPVEIHALNGEYRSGAFHVSNLSEEAVDVDIVPSLDGLLIETLNVSEVIYVESQERQVVANALPAAPYTQHGWSIRVPAGATRQVWLTAHPLGEEPRRYECRFEVRCEKLAATQTVPVNLVVYPFEFTGRPTLAVTTWDYCYPRGYIRHQDVWRHAILQMREHFISAPCFSMNAVVLRGKGPRPWIDAEGNITAHILWGRLDEWIRQWPDARFYMLILEWRAKMPESGLALGNPAHEESLREFFRMVVERFTRRGIPADRVVFHPVDEPWQESKSEAQIRWARLIKAACPEAKIFSDPIWKDPAKAPPALYATADINCPNLPLYYGEGDAAESAAAFYQELRKQGSVLWGYQCSGPVKTLDPYTYFRRQAWHAFREGMTGVGYWALADMRHRAVGTAPSWDDFTLMGDNYSIIYWDEQGVTDSKQLEGIREGVEDYEYLVMLQEAIGGAAAGKAAAAQAVLDRVVEEIGGGYSSGKLAWRGDHDRDAADRARLEILAQLTALSGEGSTGQP